MLDRTQRVAEVTSVLSKPRLKRALKKSLRILPPDEVLFKVLERDIPTLKFCDDDTVRFTTIPTGKLSRSEVLARRLIQEEGGATTLRTLQRYFVREGMSAASGSIVFSRSPILERFAYGVVGLVGGSVDSAQILALRRQVRREAARSLLGYRKFDGAVELTYRLDPALISCTLFLVPRNVIGLGEWVMEDQSARVVVKQTYVSGLHQAAKACVKSGARRMTVLFRAAARTVQVAPL